VALYDIHQETEWVYSYNCGARTWHHATLTHVTITGWLVDRCSTTLSARTGYIMQHEYEWPGTRQTHNKTINNILNRKVISAFQPGLCGDNLLTTKLGDLMAVSLANHLASTDYLTRTTKRHNTYKCKLMQKQKVSLMNSRKHKETMPRERTDRAWIRRLLQHPARKLSRSILSNRSPHRALTFRVCNLFTAQDSSKTQWKVLPVRMLAETTCL